ncbi:MAG: VOC family protein [Myxococcales bacterium]|nr:VOC family protein [Myxococcales bacterium]
MQMGKLGIKGLLGLHYYVRDLERSRRFYIERLDFEEIGKSSAELEEKGRQRSLVFGAGDIVITCSSPLGSGGRAERYLQKHPDGIGTVSFEVEDARRAFEVLEGCGGTPITEVQQHQDDSGTLATFSITTPFGDTTFRFVERRGYRGLFAGMECYQSPKGGKNSLGFDHIDHITSNFQTMAPALLWLERVMGFEQLWEVEFHTSDVAGYRVHEGSGLRSKVMWDPNSGIKLANNEPYRPYFKSSQINIFTEQHRGDGVQHAALSTPDIIGTVETLRARGVEFMPTPHSYYEALPRRLERLGVELEEDPAVLERLEILVDGAGPGQYLLQIFLKDSAGLYGAADAGPFFFEIIERKGDEGFGAGNFRALFESIERDQQAPNPPRKSG